MGQTRMTFIRAGKVRNQTPKVDKVDTSPKLTGRAKKRSKYTKRIVRNITGNSQQTQQMLKQ